MGSEKWPPEVRHFCPGKPIILIGTKMDLRDDPATQEHLSQYGRKCVSFAEGEKLATRVGAHCYVECSALSGKNIETVFQAAVDAVRRKPANGYCCTCM